MNELPGAHIITGDIHDASVRAALLTALKMTPVDVVLADLSVDRTKDNDMDCINQLKVNRSALHIAMKMLKPGGTMLMRTLKGANEPSAQEITRHLFRDLQIVTPTTFAELDP
jgi:23S rRNA U2552 (ribose-2'-O)-methylase RlmE/FtsJ